MVINWGLSHTPFAHTHTPTCSITVYVDGIVPETTDLFFGVEYNLIQYFARNGDKDRH